MSRLAAGGPLWSPRVRGLRLGWIGLAAMLAVGAALLFYETRGTTLWFDEWPWALSRRGGGLDTFLAPHNEHLSLVPVTLYKLLFATAGLDDYAPYRAMGIAAHLLCVALVYAYVSRRLGTMPALAGAALILFLGPAWQNLLWPFQTGSLISLAAGLGALLALDREDRAGDVGACLLLALSLASSGLGLPIAAGVLVELLWIRRRRRALWVVVAPLALYAAWWLAYQDSTLTRRNLVLAPGFVADSAASALSALTGLSGVPEADDDATLGWGRPLAVAAAAVVAWRLTRLRPIPPRVISLLSILFVFWGATAVQRGGLSDPDESRYLYFGAVFVVLLTAELAHGVRLSRPWALAAGVAAALAVVANVGDLREAGRFARDQGERTRAVLGAVELARSVVAPELVLAQLPGYPLLVMAAGPYLAAAEALGSPADGPAEIAAADEDVRLAVDLELARIHRVELEPAPAGVPLGPRPEVDAVSGGSVTGRGACVTFTPSAVAPAAETSTIALPVPSGGVVRTARGGPADVALRRFAAGFPAEPQWRLAPSASAVLRIGPDRAPQPWHVRLAPEGRVTACGLP
jgi:hypothetical protein